MTVISVIIWNGKDLIALSALGLSLLSVIVYRLYLSIEDYYRKCKRKFKSKQ